MNSLNSPRRSPLLLLSVSTPRDDDGVRLWPIDSSFERRRPRHRLCHIWVRLQGRGTRLYSQHSQHPLIFVIPQIHSHFDQCLRLPQKVSLVTKVCGYYSDGNFTPVAKFLSLSYRHHCITSFSRSWYQSHTLSPSTRAARICSSMRTTAPPPPVA